LTVLYHSSFPTAQPSSSSTPLLLPLLTSIDLCPSLAQIRLHPSALIEHLASAYNIRVGQEDSEHDLRIYDFLSRFHERLWGSGFRRPDEEEDQDEAATRLDALGDARVGKCVLEWMTRGPKFRTNRTASVLEASMPGRDSGKASRVEQGFVGVVLNTSRRKSPSRIEVMPLLSIVDEEAAGKKWTSPADDEVSRSMFESISELADRVFAQEQDPAAAITAGLSFNLNLTERQRTAKSGVDLPFTPKEDTSGRPGGQSHLPQNLVHAADNVIQVGRSHIYQILQMIWTKRTPMRTLKYSDTHPEYCGMNPLPPQQTPPGLREGIRRHCCISFIRILWPRSFPDRVLALSAWVHPMAFALFLLLSRNLPAPSARCFMV
jgi:hypothetical protein